MLFALPATPADASEQSRSYAIPAGGLDQVLNRFASEAGILLSADAQLTAGKRSAGLNGSYSVEDGLARLLAGTGLRALKSGGNYTVEFAADYGGALELGATSVTGSRLGWATEGSGSYTTGTMQTATKLPLTIRETPQSVTVITRQRMDDQVMNTLDDVVRNTPGMSSQRFGPDRQRYYSRGYQVDNLMYDGIPTNVGGNAADIIASGDLAMYDHVEIVRGSTGLMQGSGNPAASINLVRKKPTAETQASITANAGSWDRYRTEADVSGPLNDQGTVRGRFVGAYQNNHSFQDNVQTERGVYYGVLDADLTDDTLLTIGASYQDDNNHLPWGGLPVAADGSDLHQPRSTYLGNDWDYWDKDTTTAFAKIEHNLANDWKLTVAGNKIWSKLKHLASKVNNDEDVYSQIIGGYKYDDTQTGVDAFASGPFQLFEREHQLVVGASTRNEKIKIIERTDNSVWDDIDVHNWDPSLRPKPTTLVSNYWQYIDIEQKSAYVTGRFSLADPLHLILGSRLDWYDYDAGSNYGNVDYKVTRHVTKYAGLVYDLNDNHSVYVSYTDIFKPQNYLNASGGLLAPVVGKNYEVGIKGEYFNGALNGSIALFRMDQENRARVADGCPTAVTCYEAAGKVRAQGIDMELQGAITPRWQVGAGYTYTEVKYRTDSNPANIGRSFDTDLPRHLVKLTTSYQMPGELERWRVGGTVYGQNTVYNKDANYKIEQKAYALLDLMVGFKPTEHIDARLNLNNVFDKKYYVSITDDPWLAENIYGDPRNLMLSVKYSF
ncbi:ligand-gated channel [Pseudomonas sp. 10-1B]|nr:ligand-gated channel [Pseudomonas sp. 10-1B]